MLFGWGTWKFPGGGAQDRRGPGCPPERTDDAVTAVVCIFETLFCC